MRAALTRIKEFVFRTRVVADQDEEFRFHREMEIEHNRRLGMSEDAARRAAVIAFGGEQRFREETHDARGLVTLDNLLRDTVRAVRRIRRSPGFAAGTIATLGIGIGAAAGIGTIVYGVLLRDLPYADPDALVRVSFTTPGLPATSGDLHSEATAAHFIASAHSFEGLGVYYTNDAINLTDGAEAERITAGMVSPSTFHLLGARPVLGQLFDNADTLWAGAIPVLMAEELWERRYARDPSIIGKTIEINRDRRRVVGILPRSFDFPLPSVRIWYPQSITVEAPSLGGRYLNVIGRLRRGIPMEEAQGELNALLPRLATRYPTITRDAIARSGARVTLATLKSATVAPVRAHLVLLGVMVLVILLIATTNVVSLFLLRAERAGQEIAIALSLGATRGDLARRFMVEGMVLGAASVIVALPVTAAVLATKLGFGASEIPRVHEVNFDGRTVALVAGAALMIGAAIGLTALTHTGVAHLADRLRGARATMSVAWRRAQRALVAAQIALALSLLIAVGLLGRSFLNLRNAPLGFDPAGAMVFEVSLPYNGYGSYGEGAAFHARVVDRLRELPGVTGAVAAMTLPLTPGGGPALTQRLEVDGPSTATVPAHANLVAADYFRQMAIPLRGRSFASGDLLGTPAIVISSSLAQALFGSADPMGRTIRRATAPGRTPMRFRVVGVAGDVPPERIEDGPLPTVYFPLLRDGDGLPKDSFPLPYVPRWVTYVVRGSSLPSPQTIRRLIHDLDGRIPPVHIRPLASLVDASTTRVRLTLLLLGMAGSAALLLGVIGVYSVVSYAAEGRLREFGVRLALGATPGHVGSMILREGVILAGTGIAAGFAVAWVGTRFLRTLLFEVSPLSAPEFTSAALLLVGVALLATIIPARRASRTDPAIVLRGE